MAGADRLALVDRLMNRYNSGDAIGYAVLMTDAAVEAVYRGAVLRDGRGGIIAGLSALFAQYPQNHAVVLARYAIGEIVVLHEQVCRAPDVAPFEVISIYSFAGDRVERVEFVR